MNTTTCPNCKTENKAVKRVCWSCGFDLRANEPYTPSERNQEIVNLIEGGMTKTAVAKRFGVSLTRVRQIERQVKEWRDRPS